MITKKSVFAQVFVVMFALLLALSFAACSTTTVSGASIKSPDNVTLSLKSSTFSGTVGDNKQTTTNTYNVYYTGDAPTEVKISLGISAKDGWIDFKKPGIATINFTAVDGLTFASETGKELNYADMEEDDWVVTIPAGKLDGIALL